MSTDPSQGPVTADVVGRQDLSSAFGPSSRTAGLGGRLKRPAPPAQSDPDLADRGAAVAREQQDNDDDGTGPTHEPPTPAKRRSTGERASKTSPAPAKAKPPADPSTGSRATNTNYPVHVPADLVPLFNEHRDQQGTSNTLLVFDAIDALVDHDSNDPYARLRDAVRGDVIGAQPSSLFTRAPRRARPSTDGPRARSQIMLRMSEDNRAVIEQLVTETGALDRSHLITVALTEFLTPSTH